MYGIVRYVWNFVDTYANVYFTVRQLIAPYFNRLLKETTRGLVYCGRCVAAITRRVTLITPDGIFWEIV